MYFPYYCDLGFGCVTFSCTFFFTFPPFSLLNSFYKQLFIFAQVCKKHGKKPPVALLARERWSRHWLGSQTPGCAEALPVCDTTTDAQGWNLRQMSSSLSSHTEPCTDFKWVFQCAPIAVPVHLAWWGNCLWMADSLGVVWVLLSILWT